MKTKEEIVTNWLPRYTGQPLEGFGEYILLTNFSGYLDTFCQMEKATVVDPNANMPCATAGNITAINFGMGSPNAATIIDLLSAIQPKATLFLGKCGGLKHVNQLGDIILPLATNTFHRKCRLYPPSIYSAPPPKWQKHSEQTTGQALS